MTYKWGQENEKKGVEGCPFLLVGSLEAEKPESIQWRGPKRGKMEDRNLFPTYGIGLEN